MTFYKIVKNCVRFLLSLTFRVDIQGKENIPAEGQAIVCSNHFNLLDPVFIGTCLPRQINYMAKEELFSNKLFGNILRKLGVFPVKRGSADISAIKAALKLLKENKILGIFPEGTRSKTGEMLEAKPGLAMIAIKSQSPIIPVAIVGNYKLFSKIHIIIDRPIELSEYYGKKLSIEEYQSLSQGVLDHIQKLIHEQKANA